MSYQVKPKQIFIFGLIVLLITIHIDSIAQSKVFPYSDPINEGEWILNKEVSDEFESIQLDTKKWHVQGSNGNYRSNWIGRAPSQFSTNNLRVEEGRLKIETRWDTVFIFSDKLDYTYPEVEGQGRKYENITTAAVICKNSFHYGYMEIKCKAGDASVTSSFWALGNRTELDVFEFIGAPSKAGKEFIGTRFMSNMIDWNKPRDTRRVWRETYQLDWRVADDFHIYACEWDTEYLKFYADGKLIYSITKEELGEAWVLNKPLWIWVDSETFPWDGIPEEADLPVDFEIEYIRVWNKKGQ